MADERGPNGKLTVWGYTERLAKLAAILLIPILIWAIRIEVFYQAGPRFTAQDAENLMLTMRQQWQKELQNAIKDGQLPVAALRLTNLEEDVKEIRLELGHVRNTVSENKQTLTAIQLLLEDRAR